MSINPINPINQVSNNAIPGQNPPVAAQTAAAPAQNDNLNARDLFQTNTTRSARSVDMGTINRSISQREQQVDAFRQLVERLLDRQGATWTNASGEVMVEIDEATRLRAQEEIGEGGYFSVEAVAGRLLDFARAFAGNDPERIELMRTAVQMGFEAAEAQWGGRLPDISHQTLEAVMAGFDDWLANINNS